MVIHLVNVCAKLEPDDGLLSLDSSIALIIGLLLTTVLVRLLISFWFSWVTIRMSLEYQSSWINIDRVLNADVHMATRMQDLSGNLVLTMVNGTVYRYLTNVNKQFVRVQQGGGTSVLGAGVESIQISLGDKGVFILGQFVDGSSHEIFLSPLPS